MSTTLSSYFPPEKIQEIATEIVQTATSKHEDAVMNFYNNMENYLYEIYGNFEDSVKTKLAREMAELFIKDPKNYKFRDLREKLFIENKETLTSILIEEEVEKEVERVILKHTHKEAYWPTRWGEHIVKCISEKAQHFADNEIIQNAFLQENNRLKSQIKFLESRIRELED